MQAVVPAAGEGTRLRPLTESRPKGLVEVAGRPILSHCFDRLVEVGVDRLVVVVGYLGKQIVERYGEAYGETPIEYARQDDRKGLAHAIAQAAPAIDDDFLVVNGDNVLGTTLSPVVGVQRRPDVDATLLVERAPPEIARETGVVTTGDDGSVTGIVEKPADPPSTLVTTGVYALPPAIFEDCRRIASSDRGEYELADAVDRLRRRGGTVRTVDLDGWRVNVNTPADLREAERRIDAP